MHATVALSTKMLSELLNDSSVMRLAGEGYTDDSGISMLLTTRELG